MIAKQVINVRGWVESGHVEIENTKIGKQVNVFRTRNAESHSPRSRSRFCAVSAYVFLLRNTSSPERLMIIFRSEDDMHVVGSSDTDTCTFWYTTHDSESNVELTYYACVIVSASQAGRHRHEATEASIIKMDMEKNNNQQM